jgi:exosortase A-associated hydrolase 2
MILPVNLKVRPVFIGPRSDRFCVFYEPETRCRGTVLFVLPFAEEMNKSRRMASLMARTLGQAGYASLIIDLYGCGDSHGHLREATWAQWKEDLTCAAGWLFEAVSAPLSLLGLRLGGLLAMDFAKTHPFPVKRVVLWQPAISGKNYIAQFMRLKVAGEMLSGNKASSGVAGLRRELSDEGSIEIAGYTLSSALATGIEAVDMPGTAFETTCEWFEIGQNQNVPLSPATLHAIESLKKRNDKMTVRTHQVEGPAFWQTQEITDCPALIERTAEVFRV